MGRIPYITALSLAAGALHAQAATMACGGIGSDERRELAAQFGSANMALEFVLAGRGNYVADVDVTLTPAAPGEALSVKTDGPICYLQLPPGRYTIDAAYNGERKSASATVPARPGRPVRVTIAFPPGARDIDPAPVSPEEKRQASQP